MENIEKAKKRLVDYALEKRFLTIFEKPVEKVYVIEKDNTVNELSGLDALKDEKYSVNLRIEFNDGAIEDLGYAKLRYLNDKGDYFLATLYNAYTNIDITKEYNQAKKAQRIYWALDHGAHETNSISYISNMQFKKLIGTRFIDVEPKDIVEGDCLIFKTKEMCNQDMESEMRMIEVDSVFFDGEFLYISKREEMAEEHNEGECTYKEVAFEEFVNVDLSREIEQIKDSIRRKNEQSGNDGFEFEI